MSDVESTPAVVAYRVGQLEQTQKEGFAALTDKLDKITDGFVTAKELTEARLDGEAEHKRLWKEINTIKSWASWAFRAIVVALLGAGLTFLLTK